MNLSPVPILVRGGPKMESDEGMLQMVKDAIDGGAAGLVFGRNVWQHKDPARILKALAGIVHERGTVKEALSILNNRSHR